MVKETNSKEEGQMLAVRKKKECDLVLMPSIGKGKSVRVSCVCES